jgi:hypothetical protein
MRVAFALAATVAALALPAAARAAPALEFHVAKQTVGYGAALNITGSLLDGTTPIPNQTIVLEGQRYPFQGSYREIARTTTDAKGEFAFKPVLDRNHKLRIDAPDAKILSEPQHAYIVPSTELSFRALKPGVVRLYQRYTVPKSVKLTQPTLFYLGSRKAKTATKRVQGKVKRTSSGHFTSIATVKLPSGWHGAFKYGSCFRTSPHSGMGAPLASCPKLKFRF